MIKLRLLLIAPTLLSANLKIGKIDNIYQYKNQIDEIIATPSSGTHFDITVAASSTVEEYRKLTCVLYNPKTDSNEILFSITFSTKDYITTQTIYCLINWEDANITVNLYSRRTSPIHKHSFTLKNRQNNVNISNYNYTNYQTEPRAYYFYHGSGSYIVELYRFSGFAAEFYPTKGLCYQLNSGSFTYSLLSPLATFKCERASFYVDNSNHYFDDIRNEGITGTGCEIALKCVSQNGQIRFSFVNQMYVDPLTLFMSKKGKPGYVKTDNFYFPINYFANKNTELLLFTLYECGYSRATISIPFEFCITSGFYGLCQNSTYCLQTENTEPDFELGKTIEH